VRVYSWQVVPGCVVIFTGVELAITVTHRNGKTQTMDGLFAKTKEVLGGVALDPNK